MTQKQIPKNWKEVELGEVCEIKKGNSITKNTITNGNIPVIAGGQQPAYYHNTSNRTGETLTVSGSGAYAGFVAYFNVPIFASDCSTIQTKSRDVFMKYIYYLLKGNQKNIYKLQRGIAQPHVYPKDLAKIKIPLPLSNGKPDLETQKKIVSILEKAEALKTRNKKVNELFDEYLKSVFAEMFVGKGFDLEEIGDLILKTETKNLDKDFPNKYFEYVDIASVDNVSKEIISTNKILGKEAPSRAKQLIRYKDILVSTVRPNLNAVAIVPENLDRQICSTGFCILRTNSRVCVPEYLFYISKTAFFIKELVSKCKGANYPAVSSTDVKRQKIPLPPVELQKKFASIVERVEKIKEKQKRELKNAEELFDSLMQKAFRGELVE